MFWNTKEQISFITWYFHPKNNKTNYWTADMETVILSLSLFLSQM